MTANCQTSATLSYITKRSGGTYSPQLVDNFFFILGVLTVKGVYFILYNLLYKKSVA